MSGMFTDKFIFRGVMIYLPFTIFLIFWLYLVSLAYEVDAWQYQVFYGNNGNLALLWMFMALFPALLFLLLKSRGKLLLSRASGAAGFYCLLGSLLSSYSFLALPGAVFLFISIVINRRLKKAHKGR